MKMLFVPEKDNVKLKIDFSVRIPIKTFIYRLCIQPLLIYRRLRYGYSFLRIPLTHGQYAIVDVKDYDKLSRYKWCADKDGRSYYATRSVRVKNGRHGHKTLRMHREIIGVCEDKIIDHINHDGLDNRRANLRFVTCAQNTWNQRKKIGVCSSKYKGVSWKRNEGKWNAALVYKGNTIFLGYFDDEKAAARAYNAKAAELFGEFASLNDI